MSNNLIKTICVDFDGTVVFHEYPEVGKSVPFAVEVLKRLNAEGVRIILWTMRSNEYLAEAKDWFDRNLIEVWSHNSNPEQSSWSDSPKCYAQAYIDDAAIGCPLVYPNNGKRPFVDWKAVEIQLEEKGFLSKREDKNA